MKKTLDNSTGMFKLSGILGFWRRNRSLVERRINNLGSGQGANGRGSWISTGFIHTTHTVTGLVNGATYVFQVRTVNAAGKSFSSNRAEATPGVGALDFAHFANGEGITSDLVFVNVETQPSGPAPTPFQVAIPPIRPALYFYDKEGNPIAAESVVEITGDLEVRADGGLSVRTEMEPLGELTISTHGQGEVVSGSVRVVSNGPIGGVLRFDLPGIGVAGVGASQPVRDALFPARREGDLSTAAAIRNLGEEAMEVSCQLMRRGTVLEEVEIPLEANGQEARYIEELFPRHGYLLFRGGGTLHRPRGGGVHRSGGGARCRQPDLRHATGGAGSREDVSGIDKGRDPVVPGFEPSQRGRSHAQGRRRRVALGRTRYGGGFCFPGFTLKKGRASCRLGFGLGRFWVLVNLFTGLVAPTTCSLTTCITTCMGDRFHR